MPRTQPPFLTYYDIVMVSVLALLVKLTRIPAGADFGSQSHVTSNSAASNSTSSYMASILLSTYSTSMVQELALKHTHNCYAMVV
jgi:hypothetical protein